MIEVPKPISVHSVDIAGEKRRFKGPYEEDVVETVAEYLEGSEHINQEFIQGMRDYADNTFMI
jgi:hypothetical protein